MIYLKQLFKALVKPKETFEELQGDVGLREGLMAWGFSMVIAVMLAYLVARQYNFNLFFIDFGIGNSVEILKMIIGLASNLVLMVVVSFIATFTASKLGGSGTFKQTFGMLGYTKGIIFLKGLANSSIMIILWIRLINTITAGAKGLPMPTNVFAGLITPIFVFVGIFMVWTLVLESYAVSVSNNISMKKAVPIMIVLTVLSGLLMGVLL